MRRFTRDELKRYHGKDGAPVYVAYRGKVYDLTSSFLWQRGQHPGLHQAGQDLTTSMDEAPHGSYVFDPFPVVGVLVKDDSEN